MDNEITLSTTKLMREKKIRKTFKIILLILLLFLLASYLVIGIVYNSGNFSITLDKNLYLERNLIVYETYDYKVYRTELFAEAPETFDDISVKWLPDNLHEHPGGSHNGENYFAYTFYIENMGNEVRDYWTEVVIDDVIKNVDEAVRVRVYRDGEEVTYAKLSPNGTAEPGTVPFESDKLVVREHISNFEPKAISKYTIVIWLEGSDPECTDNILGGEFKVHMDFKSEYKEEK